MIGSTISHYRVVSKLGEGGMGVVYKAEDTRLERTVALKFLPPHSVEERHKQRFLDEARNVARLHHPNICPIYDVDEAEGRLFFAMAYLEGQTLAERMRDGELDIGAALDIAAQIADGLEEAHQHGIVHRDIKSSNIIVNNRGQACILDFGLALRAGTQRLTVEGWRVGTPAFMSPEQARGLEVDHRTDIWSLGVVLFEMLTGRLPFVRDHADAMVHAIIHETAPALGSVRAGLSPDLQRVVDRALAKELASRWNSAGEMSAELRRIRGGQAADPTRTMAVEAPRPRSRRAMLAAAASVPVVAAGAYFGRRWLPAFSSLPQQKHIAVLPFEVIGPDENLRAITDGLVEVLTARLSEFDTPDKLLVVPASEVRSRKITSAAEARRIYGANLVIAGSAQLLRDLVQFTVTLVDAVRMHQLGARSFSFDAGNPIALRDNMLKGVLELLEVQLARQVPGPSARGETSIPGAYAEYLKGAGYLARYDKPGNIELALGSFQSALQRDPGYAMAYSGLAGAYRWKAIKTGDKQWSGLSIESAERAAKLQPRLAATHAALGEIFGAFGREEEAIQEFQTALKLAPSHGEVDRDLAEVLENLGRYTEADVMYQESVKKRPDDWYGHLLWALFLERRNRFPQAEQEFQRAIELTPNNPIAYRTLAGLYRIEGRYPAAVEQLQKALRIEPTASLHSALGVVYYFQHRFPEAAAEVQKALDLDSGRYIFWGNLGMIYQQMPGRTDDMKHALRRALELGKKYTETTPKEYNAHVNLAEYHARLGEASEADTELNTVPPAVRGQYLVHFGQVYELMGQRQKAIQCLLDLPEATPLNEVKDDPGSQGLWSDPDLQTRLKAKARR